MRIVITNCGKIEIKDDDYNFSLDNNKNVFRNISVPYKNNMSLKGSQTRKNVISIPKIRYNKFPEINKTNTSNMTSFLPKINESLSPIKSISYLNNSKKLFKKAIKINQKKLNIPNSMFEKYTNKANLDNLFKKEEDTSIKVEQTENNLFSQKNKMYTLRDILIPRNKKNLDDSFLDTKLNINGGRSIINYLQKDKIISPIYIKKVSQLRNGELLKMDKICQKYLNDEIQKKKLENAIKKKIKIGYEREAMNYEKDLKSMNNKLMDYNTIYQKLRLKKENYDNFKLLYLSTMK
jgi:hypothetical protein